MKRDKIIIFGTTMLSRDIHIMIKNEKMIDVVAYTVHERYIQECELDGVPVVPFESIEQYYSPAEYAILNTLGYTQMNTLREKVFYDIEMKGYKNYTYISTRAALDSNDIGDGNIIFPTAYIGPRVKIGKGNIITHFVSLSHSIIVGNFNYFANMNIIAGSVEITDYCFLGICANVSNSVVMAPKTFAAACSFITKSTEENSGYKGTPAVKMARTGEELVQRVIDNIHKNDK